MIDDDDKENEDKQVKGIWSTYTASEHRRIFIRAAKSGLNLPTMQRDALLLRMAQLVKEEGDEALPADQLWLMELEDNLVDEARKRIRKLCYRQITEPKPERLDAIRRMCEKIGDNFQELLDEINGDKPFIMLNGNGKLDPVQTFLTAIIPKGGKVPQKIIESEAAKIGLSPFKLKEARKHLHIRSTHSGKAESTSGKSEWEWSWDPEYLDKMASASK